MEEEERAKEAEAKRREEEERRRREEAEEEERRQEEQLRAEREEEERRREEDRLKKEEEDRRRAAEAAEEEENASRSAALAALEAEAVEECSACQQSLLHTDHKVTLPSGQRLHETCFVCLNCKGAFPLASGADSSKAYEVFDASVQTSIPRLAMAVRDLKKAVDEGATPTPQSLQHLKDCVADVRSVVAPLCPAEGKRLDFDLSEVERLGGRGSAEWGMAIVTLVTTAKRAVLCNKPAAGEFVTTEDGSRLCPACVCFGCKKRLGRTWTNIQGALFARRFHEECCLCKRCCSPLVAGADQVELNERDGAFYHRACYDAEFVPTCTACQKEIRSAMINFEGKMLHPECFTCAKCSAVLKGGSYFPSEDKAYCSFACLQGASA